MWFMCVWYMCVCNVVWGVVCVVGACICVCVCMRVCVWCVVRMYVYVCVHVVSGELFCLSLFKIYIFYFMCMGVCLHVFMCATCLQWPWSEDEAIRTPGVSDGCEPPWRCLSQRGSSFLLHLHLRSKQLRSDLLNTLFIGPCFTVIPFPAAIKKYRTRKGCHQELSPVLSA